VGAILQSLRSFRMTTVAHLCDPIRMRPRSVAVLVVAVLSTGPSAGRAQRAIAFTRVGVIDGTPMLDLEYSEDVRAEVDMNVVMTGDGRFVEVQGTAEGIAFTRDELDALLGLAESGITEIVAAQEEMVAEPPAPR